MTVAELAALLTALSLIVGAAWTVWRGVAQNSDKRGGTLWNEMMSVVQTLRDENSRLSSDNVKLRDRLAQIEKAIQQQIPVEPPKVVDATTTPPLLPPP